MTFVGFIHDGIWVENAVLKLWLLNFSFIILRSKKKTRFINLHNSMKILEGDCYLNLYDMNARLQVECR